MEMFFILLLLLVITRAFGEGAIWMGQPALIGEIIAGLLLGGIAVQFQSVENPLVDLTHNEVFQALTDLGMFFIMLYAGLEMQPHKMLKHAKSASVVAVGGMVLPLVLGVWLGWYYLPESDAKLAQMLLLGTAMSITAVPATVRILMDLNKLYSSAGQVIVSAAVIDDLLSLLLLAVLMALINGNSAFTATEATLLGGKVLLFFAITLPVGYYVFPWGGRFFDRIKSKELDFSALLVAGLAFSVLAELLALHFIIGAFIAGVFFGRNTIDSSSYEAVHSRVSGMTFGFLAPVFFASIGLHLELDALWSVPGFLVLMVVIAFLGKFLGAGLAAWAFGLSRSESAAVGIGMSARGAVEVVIAGIALKAGLFAAPEGDPIVANLFSALVIMSVVTTLLAPVLLKRLAEQI